MKKFEAKSTRAESTYKGVNNRSKTSHKHSSKDSGLCCCLCSVTVYKKKYFFCFELELFGAHDVGSLFTDEEKKRFDLQRIIHLPQMPTCL